MKRIIHVLVFAVLIFAFCACTSNINDSSSDISPTNKLNLTGSNDQTLKALQYYIEYLETCKIDMIAGIVNFRHHEDPENEQLAIENACLVLEYEIIRIKKLSNKLWVVEQF